MENIIWIIFIVFIMFLSIKLMFKQKFRCLNIFLLFKSINKNNLTSLCMFLGTKIGVGSLIGTSIAVYQGGPSSLIWMTFFSILTSSIVYEEAYLGFKHREKIDGTYISGPNYYIDNKFVKKLYLVLFLISYTFLFLMIQTNTISTIIDINIIVNKWLIFGFFAVLLTLLVNINLESILGILNKLVIAMCVLVMTMFTYVFIKNVSNIDLALNYILSDLLNTKSIIYGLIPTILISIKRCIFQSELLLGTTSISASVSEGNEVDAPSIQVLGYYFIMLVCLFTGLLIILYKVSSSYISQNYFELISKVFEFHYGRIGVFILILLFLLFGLTTIISAFYFGIKNVSKMNQRIYVVYKFFMIMVPLCGILINEGIIWKVVDTSLLILMIINSIWIYKIRK